MPYARHIRMTALGRLGDSGQERFSWSINLARTFSPNDFDSFPGSELNSNLEDAASDLVAFHSRPGSCISSRAVLEQVKFAAINEAGEYAADPFVVDVADTPGGSPHTNLTGAIVPQAALAVSLTTGRRGPSGKGRFYLPMPAVRIGGDLLISDLDSANIQASAAQFLNDINNAPGVDDAGSLKVIVASSKGFNSVVTGVRVGRVVDTVRSRRGNLNESYAAITPVS